MDEDKKIVRTGIIVIFILVVAIAAYYFFVAGRGKAPRPGEPSHRPEKVAGETTTGKEGSEPAPLLVELDKSDDPVRGLVADLSANPTLSQWLKTKDLVRKFVAAVDNIANGQSPRPQMDFFMLPGDFIVIKKNGQTLLDPSSCERYNLIADVLDSFGTAGCARIYGSLKPLCQLAYRDLGYPKEDFHRTLFRAIIEILGTPVVDDPIALEKTVTTYAMLDPKLEELSPAQKHLLRMGPENLQLIQAKLREVALALGFSEDQLPKPRPYTPGRRNF